MKKATLVLLATVALTLAGCAMTGDDDTSASSTPKNVDALHMRNGDVLVGELDLQAVVLDTEYLRELRLEPRHIESLELLESRRVRVVTRHGDILHGSVDVQEVRLRSKTGQDFVIPLAEVDRITFAE